MRKLRSAEAPRSVPSLSTSSAQDATSEAAIRSIVAEQVVAWDAGDGTRYANHLAPEASFTNLRGVKAMPGGIALPTIALGRGRF